MEERGKAITTMDEAIGKVVKCTDGSIRYLRSYDEKLGYYDLPIGDGAWMSLDGTYISQCRQMFIGGTVDISGKYSRGRVV